MKQRTTPTPTAVGSPAVRKAARDAACGKGRPGQFNPNRTVRFATADTKGRRAARGRTVRTFD